MRIGSQRDSATTCSVASSSATCHCRRPAHGHLDARRLRNADCRGVRPGLVDPSRAIPSLVPPRRSVSSRSAGVLLPRPLSTSSGPPTGDALGDTASSVSRPVCTLPWRRQGWPAGCGRGVPRSQAESLAYAPARNLLGRRLELKLFQPLLCRHVSFFQARQTVHVVGDLLLAS